MTAFSGTCPCSRCVPATLPTREESLSSMSLQPGPFFQPHFPLVKQQEFLLSFANIK